MRIPSATFSCSLNITKNRPYIPRGVQDSSDLHNVFVQAVKDEVVADRKAAQARKQVASVPAHKRLFG